MGKNLENKKVPYEKSLEFLYKDLLKEWSYELNEVEPKNVYSKSSLIVWWICKKSHSYKMKVADRTSKNKGCQYCASKIPIKGFNDLESILPNVRDYWNFEKNEKSPEEYTVGSGIKVWWINYYCYHTWEAAIRYFVNKSQKCPYCENIRLLKGFNDLETRNKEILKDWDYDKNLIKPENIKFNSNLYVYWKCSICSFRWKTRISRRTIEKTGCRECYITSKTSKSEKEVFEYIKELTPFKVISSDCKTIWPYEIDIYIPNLKIGFEFNGDYWHSNSILMEKTQMSSVEYHNMKKIRAKNRGVDLYFIWESDWVKNRDGVTADILKILNNDLKTYEVYYLSQLSKD